MEINESDLHFTFRDGVTAIKYDDEPFYRKLYNAIDGSKGVDIIADGNNDIYIIEIKNCEGTAENQDSWRRHYSGTNNMETFAEEIAQKVSHTCAGLVGAATFGQRNKQAERVLPFAKALQTDRIAALEKKLIIVLFLEGDFSCKTRSNEMIYRDIQNRIRKRLRWLNCYVTVVSTKTYSDKDFTVIQMRVGSQR